jgi:hypothetical protein
MSVDPMKDLWGVRAERSRNISSVFLGEAQLVVDRLSPNAVGPQTDGLSVIAECASAVAWMWAAVQPKSQYSHVKTG